jgi:hypothetical protein
LGLRFGMGCFRCYVLKLLGYEMGSNTDYMPEPSRLGFWIGSVIDAAP